MAKRYAFLFALLFVSSSAIFAGGDDPISSTDWIETYTSSGH